MSHIEAWSCVAIDLLHFLAYYGWIILALLSQAAFQFERDKLGDDFPKFVGSVLWVVSLFWALVVCGKAAGYWS